MILELVLVPLDFVSVFVEILALFIIIYFLFANFSPVLYREGYLQSQL